MAASDRPPSSSETPSTTAWASVDRGDVFVLVAGVTLLAIVARLVFLGDRIAHWDEARVGYWIVYYQETGSFAYRRIIHGPFIQHVNSWLFPFIGANDFTMRLPVALVGGLLPLSALLFREHLRRVEVVAMALFLSFSPVLLYYSRFMRSDLLVATFMFVTLGLFVRFYDTRKLRYVVVAAAFMALGFASKENAVIYVLTWLGALGLLADTALFRPRNYRSGYALMVDRTQDLYRRRLAPCLTAGGLLGGVLSDRARSLVSGQPSDDEDEREATNGGRTQAETTVTRDQLVDAARTFAHPFRYVVYLAIPTLVFAAVLLFMYAPRGAGLDGLRYPPEPATAGAIGFWEALRSPSTFVYMTDSTWQYASQEFGRWITQSTDAGDMGLAAQYLQFFSQYVEVMLTKAAPLTAFAIFGFIVERYGAETSRNIVMFTAYGGFVSVVGYPLGTDIFGAWLVVHALVPLSIPAAVGLARVYDWGYEAFAADDGVGVAIAALVLLLVAAQVGVVGTTSVYANHQSHENQLVQYAQPGDNPREELEMMAALGQENSGETDVVLYYGEQGENYDVNYAFVEENRDTWDSATLNTQPTCSEWFNSLPFPWYFAKDDVDVDCERESENLTDRVGTDPPPMIITQDRDTTVPTDHLEQSYEGTSYEMRAWGTDTTIWVHEDLERE